MTNPEPEPDLPEVTPEMRRAVALELCEEFGHDLSLENAIDNRTSPVATVQGPPGQFAHIFCRRCDLTFIIIEAPGRDYGDAEAKFRGMLKAPDTPKPRSGPRAQTGGPPA